MRRYIDVDELKRKINEHECYSYDPEVSRICELINDAPTLDVEPVRHGCWKLREYEYFTCSECGYDFWNGCDCTAEAKEKLTNGSYPNYCPNCGARMDGKE